jgi:hypothetical protein
MKFKVGDNVAFKQIKDSLIWVVVSTDKIHGAPRCKIKTNGVVYWCYESEIKKVGGF